MVSTFQLSCGTEIPGVGIGTWKSALGEVKAAVKDAIKIGYRHLDCAHIYLNEKEIGEALSECFNEGTVKREDLFITSKVWNNSHKREDVRSAVDLTLQNLGLDYLDMYLVHWPIALKPGVDFAGTADDFLSLEEVPLSETWEAMEETVDAGKCKGIGVSNYSVKKLKDLLEFARIKPSVNQVELHPYLQQRDLVAYCKENGIHVTAYSPLGSLDRPASMKGKEDPSLLEDAVICDIAKANKMTPAQVLIRWAVQRGTSVIPKSVKNHRLVENLNSDKHTLSEEDMDRIKNLDKHWRFINGEEWVFEGAPYTLENLWDE